MNYIHLNYKKMFLIIGIIVGLFLAGFVFLVSFPTELKDQSLNTPGTEPINNGVMCTADVKQCSDGSYVSRKAPSCAFAACPAGATKSAPPAQAEPVFCTADAKICSDGSSVGRIPPNCEFAACPR